MICERSQTSLPCPQRPAGGESCRKAPAYVPPPTQEKRQRSVVHYIAILFAAAFLLMLMTYLMDRRQNEEVVDSLNQSVSGLRESLSNMQSVQDIYEENQALLQEIDRLEDQVDELERQDSAQTTALEQAEQTRQAMDWFWQIDEAYVLGRYSLCRELIHPLRTAVWRKASPRRASPTTAASPRPSAIRRSGRPCTT